MEGGPEPAGIAGVFEGPQNDASFEGSGGLRVVINGVNKSLEL